MRWGVLFTLLFFIDCFSVSLYHKLFIFQNKTGIQIVKIIKQTLKMS